MPQPGIGRADHLELGDFNAFCSMCGKKRKASALVRNWQGLYRCPEHNEERQPQDFARGVAEDMSTPWAQVLSNNDFVPFCRFNDCSAIPGYAIPGCMTPGRKMILPPVGPQPEYILETPQGVPITTPKGGLILVPIRDPGDH